MNQRVNISLPHGIELTFKREDLLHPHISGNKFRKLKYNILEARVQGKDTLLTFGGAFSNHIAATAAAGKLHGFSTIGIIRGNELVDKVGENPTLTFARSCGMNLKFVSRDSYRHKEQKAFLEEMRDAYGEFYLLPEGGTNELAIKGCEEILYEGDASFTHIVCAAGTGGTIAGIARSARPGQRVLGVVSLKGEGLEEEIASYGVPNNWHLIKDYHFGGYGKVTKDLIVFMNDFFDKTGILLDPVYTGKMVFGVIDLARKGYFPANSQILLIHTGGLQGIAGMNKELMRKKLPIIKT